MTAKTLLPDQLRLQIDPSSLGFASTADLQVPNLPWIGQGRAEHAAPMGRMASAAEIAECVAWLAGPATLVTGELLACDAGMHLAHPLAARD